MKRILCGIILATAWCAAAFAQERSPDMEAFLK